MDQTAPPNGLSIQRVIDNMLQGVLVTTPEGIIQTVNKTFCTVTGYSRQEMIGQNPRILQSGKHPNGFYRRMWNALTQNGFWQGEIINRKKNGIFYTEMLTITSILDAQGKILNYLGVFTDITKRKAAEQTIKHMAYYDPLTDLPNRALFRDRLKQAIHLAQRNKQILAVLFIDLDRVKVINDTLGHPMGDRILKGVAQRLKSCVREGDTVARMGGDEFMLILPGMKGIEDTLKTCEKILESFKPPFHFDNHDLYMTASIGISIFPYDSKDPETLLKNADTAMYQAKRQGRNNYQLFTPSMKDEIYEQWALEHDLRRAIEQEEFIIHYQPQVSISTGQIVGMEALLRWNHRELGLIPPKQFIPWAEDSGLIIPLGEWVLETACRQNQKWIADGLPRLRISVNLSAEQFKQRGLVKSVANILAKTGLPADLLELEITESVVMENIKTTRNIPHELKAMGIRLAIDDFGTGYSSLNYLKRLPVNTLKMDQSFIQDLTNDPNDAAIASAVISLGHGLDLNVMAEGVETENQLDFLKSQQCDGMQGFLFSEPIPADEFEKLLKNKKGMTKEELLFSDC